MLEKNKDYIEMRVSSTDCAFTQNAATQISVDGCVYTPYMRLPDPGEFYILISKEKFEKMQADVNINAEIAKQWEINYDLLLKKTGFDTVEELVFYLTNIAQCDTLQKAMATLRDNMEKKLGACEKDYISAVTKAEELDKENEQLKKKLQVPDPFAEYKELLEKLYSTEDAEKFEWTLNHICGGQASANGWMVTAKLWRRNYETLSKLVGFSSTEEIQDYLTNEAECDTLQEAISKLKDQVKYTCEEWYSANNNNNSWKAAAECNSPKELIEKRETLEKEVEIYSRTLNEWKAGTNCPSPSVAKTLIESGMSYEYAYHESQKENRKLTEEVDSWKNVTGYSTPEDYMHARISGAFHTPFDYTSAWQKATGFVTPEQAKSRIEEFERIVRLTNKNMLSTLDSEIDEWQKFTGCDSTQKAGCKINDLCDEICKLKGDYDRLLKLTGYKSEDGIRVALTYSEQFVYETMRELINSLKRKAEFTESNWQAATGCDAPDDAETTIRNLRGRIDEIKEFAAIASNWTDRIVED